MSSYLDYDPSGDPAWHDFARRYAAADQAGRQEILDSMTMERKAAFQKVWEKLGPGLEAARVAAPPKVAIPGPQAAGRGNIAPKKRQGADQRLPWGSISALGAVAIVLLVGIQFADEIAEYTLTNNGGAPRPRRALVDEFDAQVDCRDFVDQRLRSPASANHPGTTEIGIAGRGLHWIVVGYVDSQNGFGAPVRTHYYCEINYSPNGKRVFLKDLIMPIEASDWRRILRTALGE